MKIKLTAAAFITVFGLFGLLFAVFGPLSGPAVVADNSIPGDSCKDLPSYDDLTDALEAVLDAGGNAGLANDMWATIINRDGEVCEVTFSGNDRGAQWPGSRVISAQKANTANLFSLPLGAGGISGLALSTGNLYNTVQPGGSLFGLQFSNPVDTDVAYGGNSKNYGQDNDPMVGGKIGGVNVFGGGLGLYASDGSLLGGIGLSGDFSCTDHVIAWKVRDALGLDNVPAGISLTGDDNIILDLTNGFGHPDCGDGVKLISDALPVTHPIGP